MKSFGKPNEDGASTTRSSGRSAEQFVALTLVGVCVVAGAGIWLANRGDHSEAATAAATPAASAAATPAPETPASNWQGQLEGEIDKLDRARAQQQRSTEAENLAQQDRERQLQDLERRKRELAAQAAALAAASANVPRTDTGPRAPSSIAAKTETASIAPQETIPARIVKDNCAPPQYPASAERLQQEGQVVLGFQIDTQGHVIDQRIDKSSGHPQLDVAAQRALARCRFTPSTVDGVTQTAWTQVRFTWKLGH